ncbi:DUF3325 domain-containing protein [Piscinibacter gummiphilus]|uniref:DUF3325 domain-containing protein n=1 Tax=Piscinibacter gummiphilus TaxID=946333 RepID=UPI0012FD82F7|nr:DUF3325 domain-containing protein [Piscinibacter gummiphilus]GLS96180.1 iron uptake protein [Piscinibacter gummiphilus]
MSAVVWAVVSLVAAFGGFVALSLAMDRHHEQVFGRGADLPRRRRWALRLTGTGALGVSLAASLAAQGPTQGWVLWCGVLTVAAVGQVLALTYAPHA